MQKFNLALSIIGTAIMIVIMSRTGKSLKTTATPNGILNLEFAYNQQKVNTILDAWSQPKWNLNATIPSENPDRLKAAKINTWWDFLFLFFYSFLFYNLCYFLYRKLQPASFGKAGIFFAKLGIVTALLDIVENIFMLSVLNNHYTGWYLPVMSGVSVLKWLLVFIIILYCLIGFGKLGLKKIK